MYGITPSSHISGLIGRRGSTIIHGNSNIPPLAKATESTPKERNNQVCTYSELSFSSSMNELKLHVPIICLLVIPFSVIVSCMYSIDAGKMKACLSTIGNLVVAKEENTETRSQQSLIK